jgi:hypothetical protein
VRSKSGQRGSTPRPVGSLVNCQAAVDSVTLSMRTTGKVVDVGHFRQQLALGLTAPRVTDRPVGTFRSLRHTALRRDTICNCATTLRSGRSSYWRLAHSMWKRDDHLTRRHAKCRKLAPPPPAIIQTWSRARRSWSRIRPELSWPPVSSAKVARETSQGSEASVLPVATPS